MSWDQPQAFIIDLHVASEHIDELGHANNAVYVTWLERCAWQHSQSLGLGIEDYHRRTAPWPFCGTRSTTGSGLRR